MEQIFVSSVQKELQADRHAVRDFVHNNALLQQFFRVFLFEDLPPTDRRADEVYLDEVAKSRIYVGIFGNEYGWEDDSGLSPTEKEFDFAAKQRKRRFIFVRGYDDKNRHPKMKKLIRKAGDEVVRRRYADTDEMLRLLYGSLIRYLQDQGVIATADFDATPCPGVTLKDISQKKLRWFLEKAREERGYALSADTPRKKALAHLNLLAKSVPTKGAVLLFGNAPERHIHSAEITCLHFHGTEIEKPIPSQQVYHGTLFELVDQAVDFIMARIARAVEPSSASPESRVRYEVPYRAVREAIVNAVAHRNYASLSGVQVMVFADRIEVWNPGGLPEDLTVDLLRGPHPSVPRNRLLCEPLFLAHYIERAGTGTLDMIRLCADAGLPEPEFLNEGERFRLIIWRDWLTESVMDKLGLMDRERKLVSLLKTRGRIGNKEYQEEFGVSKPTASRHLEALMDKSILTKIGTTGKGTYYVLSRKGLVKGSKDSRHAKGS
ncbi:MAG: transcriptional regulator [Deltaproteobacteria bacterium]|nr:MAG: transcriptional regulator [Deltaproteobacteria bacterium]